MGYRLQGLRSCCLGLILDQAERNDDVRLYFTVLTRELRFSFSLLSAFIPTSEHVLLLLVEAELIYKLLRAAYLLATIATHISAHPNERLQCMIGAHLPK